MPRYLYDKEAEAAIRSLDSADGGLPGGREFHYEIEGASETIVGLIVDLGPESVTLVDDSTHENAHHTLSWGEIRSVKVRGSGIAR